MSEKTKKLSRDDANQLLEDNVGKLALLTMVFLSDEDACSRGEGIENWAGATRGAGLVLRDIWSDLSVISDAF